LRKLLALSVIVFTVGAASATHARGGSSADYITSGLLCIHRYEGAWNANTGNGYYGGLQMNYDFMRSYGKRFLYRWGTANRWPVWAQLQAGRNGFHARGWNPWPNTARYCHLI
jgi:resuscitation-promoting factor RpfA